MASLPLAPRFFKSDVMYEYHESFKHKAAKELLYKWLWHIDKGLPFPDEIESRNLSMPFCWRQGNYGVHMELPFHEKDDQYYFENSVGITEDRWDNVGLEKFDPSIDRGRILFVPDICIFHKGTACIFIEVVHKNKTSISKIKRIEKFCGSCWFEIYEIEAESILSQTNKFCNLQFTTIYKEGINYAYNNKTFR